MAGFPNVGKSSLINVLIGEKKVGVDIKPGKTRNFQTLYLSQDILLMDCPGLVFPLIASSKAEMICNGVLPLSSMVDYIDPIKYILYKSDLELILRKFKLPLDLVDIKSLSDQQLGKWARDVL